MKDSFFLQTFGCRVNQYESQAIREQLLNAGLEEAPSRSAADVVVINSCSVTERSDRECFSEVRTIHRNNLNARIVGKRPKSPITIERRPEGGQPHSQPVPVSAKFLGPPRSG